MSDLKHSPGPWHWNGNSLISGKHGYYLMHTEECPGLGHSAEANKRLIAAAPDLLDALKTLWKATDAGPDTSTDLWTDAALKYRAAIAKVEGRS
ncbi:hypothetical protein QWJ46_00435 [Rhizobium sp. CBN3]|uniref:hypothetical protein n=1 Tax=Rhizobium sp. CBN3 TaxID=3058045 RepID=UPI002673371B|nr:hypothetical protein [Rhizobium sp. CBN3]MDO3431140.1 hypothetical protein [Rhizobium sp. CBN3]